MCQPGNFFVQRHISEGEMKNLFYVNIFLFMACFILFFYFVLITWVLSERETTWAMALTHGVQRF